MTEEVPNLVANTLERIKGLQARLEIFVASPEDRGPNELREIRHGLTTLSSEIDEIEASAAYGTRLRALSAELSAAFTDVERLAGAE